MGHCLVHKPLHMRMRPHTVIKFVEAAMSKAMATCPLVLAHVLARHWPHPPDMFALVRGSAVNWVHMLALWR